MAKDENEKSQRPIGFLEMPEFFSHIPWGQHIDIVSRCKTLDEALFYAHHKEHGKKLPACLRGIEWEG